MDDEIVAELLKEGCHLDKIKELISKGDIMKNLPAWDVPALTFMVCRYDGFVNINERDEIISFIINEETKTRRERNLWQDENIKLYLLYALENKISDKIIYELINMGSNVNATFRSKWTPLYYAIMNNYSLNLIKTLIEYGADIYYDFYTLWLAINVLCENDKINDCDSKNMTHFLMSEGLDLKKTDCNGNTVMHLANCKFVVNSCLKQGISIEIQNNYGFTPLMSAVINGKMRKVDTLLKLGANPNYCLVFALVVLPALYTKNSSKISEFLKEDFGPNDCHIKIFDRARNLTESNKDITIELLLYHGADLCYKTDVNQTPLGAISEANNFTYYRERFICHYLLFTDDQDDLQNTFSNLTDFKKKPQQDFLEECKSELNKMKETYIKEGLTFYEFCRLKKFYSSDITYLSCGKLKYSYENVKKLFPLYNDIIIMRIRDNISKRWQKIIKDILENITISPNLSESNVDSYLNYDCLYKISNNLSSQEIYNLFLASAA